MKQAMAAIFATALAALFLAAAFADSKVTSPETGLAASLLLEASSYKQPKDGTVSTMQATYTVSNPTDQPIQYKQSGRGIQWKILDSGGQLLYDPSRGRPIPMFIALHTLQPGQNQEFTQVINLQNQDGTPLAVGKYTLQACLATDKSLQTSQDFTVK